LLVLLDATNARERLLQGRVHPCACVREAQRFGFDAVHQNDAHARERVVAELVVRRLHELAPREPLLVQRHAAIAKKIDCHEMLLPSQVGGRRDGR